MNSEKWEPLARGCSVLVTREYSFTTDTLLLAAFSAPRKGELCFDFGTGCAAIPIIWAARHSPRKVYGIELQSEAAELAGRSVKENGLFDTVEIICADIRELKKLFPQQCAGLIACNPPYKAAGAGLMNPDDKRRLARHEEELTLDQLAESAQWLLKNTGRLCICQRPERLADAFEAFRGHRLEPKRLRLVQQREGVRPSLFLLEARKAAGPGLAVEPTLTIENGTGGYSAEMLEIYGDYMQNNSEGG